MKTKDKVLYVASWVFLFGLAGVFGTLGVQAFLDGALQRAGLWGGLTLVVLFFGQALSNTDLSQNEPSVPEEAPWTVRDEWQTDEMTDESPYDWDPTGSLPVSRGFATWGHVILWPLCATLVYNQIWASPTPNWNILYILVPAIIAVLALTWVTILRPKLHRQKYGPSTLTLDTMPGRLGKRLRARLQTGVPPEEAPDDGFAVRLSCQEQYEVPDPHPEFNDVDSGYDRDVKWEKSLQVRGRQGTEGIEVPISISLPPDQPPSSSKKEGERILWELTVRAETAGLDYESSFEIPVFAPEVPNSQSTPPQKDSDKAWE